MVNNILCVRFSQLYFILLIIDPHLAQSSDSYDQGFSATAQQYSRMYCAFLISSTQRIYIRFVSAQSESIPASNYTTNIQSSTSSARAGGSSSQVHTSQVIYIYLHTNSILHRFTYHHLKHLPPHLHLHPQPRPTLTQVAPTSHSPLTNGSKPAP
jgi:hypothetical protein